MPVVTEGEALTEEARMISLGSSGLKESGGFILEEWMVRLRGRNGIKLYREMSDTNAVLGGIQFLTKSLVRQAEWRVETPKGMEDDETAIHWRDFIEGAIDDMEAEHPWEELLSEVMSMMNFGYAPFEIVYKKRRGESQDPKLNSEFNDGLWGWRKIEIRAQETIWRWEYDDDNTLVGMEQIDDYRAVNNSGAPIPIEKIALFKTESHKGNPEGRSMLRNAVRSYYYLKRIQELEAIGIERELAGMPFMEVPLKILADDASDTDKSIRAQLEKMIQQIKRDERYGGLLPTSLDTDGKPTGYKFGLVNTGGKRQVETDPIIRRYESRIAMIFLADFVIIGNEKVGGTSVFVGKSDLFAVALGAFMNTIASTFTSSCINRLMKMNAVPKEYWPRMTHGDLDSPDLEKMGKFVESMASAGLLSGGNNELENKLLTMADLPVPVEEDDPISDPSVVTPADGADASTGLLSERQVTTILEVNARVKDRSLDVPAAEQLLASVLGMDPTQVGRFLNEPGEEPEIPEQLEEASGLPSTLENQGAKDEDDEEDDTASE